jgi:hypothetical protein
MDPRTERLALRRLVPTDVDDLTGLDGDPEVMRLLTNGKPAPRRVPPGVRETPRPALARTVPAPPKRAPLYMPGRVQGNPAQNSRPAGLPSWGRGPPLSSRW